MQKFLTLIIAVFIIYSIVELKLEQSGEFAFTKQIKTTIQEKTQIQVKNQNQNQENVTNDKTEGAAQNQPNIANKTVTADKIPSQAIDNNKVIEPELSGNFFEKTLSSVLINVLKTEEGRLFFENILQPADKALTGGDSSFKVNNDHLLKSIFKIKTLGNGTIGPASCGHIATIHYHIQDLQGNVIEEATKTYALGSRPVIPALDAVVVGMMVGETRNAIAPAKFAFAEAKSHNPAIDPSASYKIIVVLQDLLPHNFLSDKDFKIFDDEIAYKMPLMCGDYVKFDATITNLVNGRNIYDSKTTGKKITMRIGDITYPMVFSHSLHNKIPVGTRTVIAKGKAFKSFANGASAIFPRNQLPESEYFMLELSNFQLVDIPVPAALNIPDTKDDSRI